MSSGNLHFNGSVSVENRTEIKPYASIDEVTIQLGSSSEGIVEISFTDKAIDALIAAAISGRERMRAKRQHADELEQLEEVTTAG